MMQKFRTNPPSSINGVTVTRSLDYMTLKETNLIWGETITLNFPTSDVLQFYLEDGTKISVRPSGTEPKIKFYISVNTRLNSRAEFESVNNNLDKKIFAFEKFLLAL